MLNHLGDSAHTVHPWYPGTVFNFYKSFRWVPQAAVRSRARDWRKGNGFGDAERCTVESIVGTDSEGHLQPAFTPVQAIRVYRYLVPYLYTSADDHSPPGCDPTLGTPHIAVLRTPLDNAPGEFHGSSEVSASGTPVVYSHERNQIVMDPIDERTTTPVSEPSGDFESHAAPPSTPPQGVGHQSPTHQGTTMDDTMRLEGAGPREEDIHHADGLPAAGDDPTFGSDATNSSSEREIPETSVGAVSLHEFSKHADMEKPSPSPKPFSLDLIRARVRCRAQSPCHAVQ